MPFNITGKIEVIEATASIPSKDGSKVFYKRNFVLDCTRYNPETGEPWENHPKFEVSGNNCNMLDGFSIGQKVSVDFSLRGAKYNDPQTGEVKYFTSINAFKISAVDSRQEQQSYQEQRSELPKADVNETVSKEKDDLPF